MIKVIVDCFGGDHSPTENILGALEALNLHEDLFILLTGDKDIINPILEKETYDKSRLEILDAKEVISCNEVPTLATFRKKDSSLMKAIETLKDDESYAGMVSLASTGALLVGSTIKIKKLDNVIRPACIPIMPTMNNDIVAVCDSGANVDCSKEELLQFAEMGSLYLKCCFNKDSPRVALLNIGVEEIKGDNLRKEVYPLLEECKSINFVGNMESRDLLTGDYDLVVSDGFAGNVLIKSTEGTAIELLKLLKRTFTKSFKNKMGALILKKDIYEIKDFMDPNNYGGALLIGLRKLVVKAHGNAKRVSVRKSVEIVYNLAKNNFLEKMKEELAKTFVEEKQSVEEGK